MTSSFPDFPDASPSNTEDPFVRSLQRKLAFVNRRERLGVRHRHACSPSQLTEVGKTLIELCESGDDSAVVRCLSIRFGFSERVTMRLPVEAQGTSSAASYIDLGLGVIVVDLDRVLVNARKMSNAHSLPAGKRLLLPIPTRLIAPLRSRAAALPSARTVAELCPQAKPTPQVAVLPGAFGRLRPTTRRMRNGMIAVCLDRGVDAAALALVSNEYQLIPRARTYYVAVDKAVLLQACAVIDGTLGWGSTSESLGALHIGSAAVPSEATLEAIWSEFADRCDRLRPPARSTTARLVEFHYVFVRLVGWLFALAIGLRESKEIDISARHCRPGTWFITLDDKRIGGKPSPIALPRTMRDQVARYYAHLESLVRRAHRCGCQDPWIETARGVLDGADLPLLFTIDQAARARPLATADLLDGSRWKKCIAPNFGRHWGQTLLHANGVQSAIVDMVARHAQRDTASSTTLLSATWAAVTTEPVVEQALRGLHIRAIAGLGRRSAS